MIAGLTLDAILSAHGVVGGGLSSSFGNGSDGAFNPSGTGSQTTNTIDTLHNTTNTNYAANSTIKNKFSTSWGEGVTVTLTGVTWACSSGNTGVAYIWDSQGNLLGQTNSGNIGGLLTFTTPVQLQSGQTYNIGVRSSDANTVGFYQGGSNLQTAQSVNGATFTLGLNSNTWYGTPAAGTMPSDTSNTMYAEGFSINVTVNNQTLYTFSSTLDGPAVVKQFTSVNIPANVMVTVSNRCKGLIMLVNGDVTINGAINMDGMAAISDPTDMNNNPAYVSIDKASKLYDPTQPTSKQKSIVIGPGGIGGSGGAGGSGGVTSAPQSPIGGEPTPGTWWGGGRGGGGGGGNSLTVSYQGGTGGDASYIGSGTPGAAATANGNGNSGTGGSGGSGARYYSGSSGAGGNAYGAGGGGGGGTQIYSGTAGNGADSNGGAGGLILIVASGNITINNGAVLSAKGSAGGSGGNASAGTGSQQGGGGGGGGGAGGGIIAILYKKALTNSGTLNVSGGPGGVGGSPTGSNAYAGYNGRNGASGATQLIAL